MARGLNTFSFSGRRDADRLAQSTFGGYVDKRPKRPFGCALCDFNLAMGVFDHLFLLGNAQCEHAIFVVRANAFAVYRVG